MGEILTRAEIVVAHKMGVDVNELRRHKLRELRGAAADGAPSAGGPSGPAGETEESQLQITLHGEVADKIAAAAANAGRTPEELLTEILVAYLNQNGGAGAERSSWPRPPAGVKFGAPTALPTRSITTRARGRVS